MLAETGMVTDPTKIWWDPRPSAKHPTLEIRICDICTWAEDGLTIAALYQSILAFLYHLKANNQRWRHYRRILILENKWRAQRYGVGAEPPTSASASWCRCPRLSTSWSSCCARMRRRSAASPRSKRPRHGAARVERRPAAAGLSRCARWRRERSGRRRWRSWTGWSTACGHGLPAGLAAEMMRKV